MTTFLPVDDAMLASRITGAKRSVVFVAPAVSIIVATAIGERLSTAPPALVTVILDADEEPYRLGYGDLEGLGLLRRIADTHQIPLRCQPGLRLGLLLTDDAVLLWAPTPRSVEEPRTEAQPNGIELLSPPGAPKSLSESLGAAVGADDSEVAIDDAQIGRKAFTPVEVAALSKALAENPPGPFDLSRKTRVFSTRYQFVEHELRGAAWTQREIKLSSLLLNSDLPENLRDLLDTRVKPFAQRGEVSIEVPALVNGELAFARDGKQLKQAMTQSQLVAAWTGITRRYLRQLKGFGWLVERRRKAAFEKEVQDYEVALGAWVEGFRKQAGKDEDTLVDQIVGVILKRASLSGQALRETDVAAAVQKGLRRLRVTEPGVKLVFKEIAWESTRDEEFVQALHTALPEAAKEPWFRTFIAALQR